MRRTIAAAVAVVVTLVIALPATAATPTFRGSVGPGFTIVLPAKPKKAGKIRLTLSDKSNIHNFHLVGPGGKAVLAVKAGKAVRSVDTGVGPIGTTSYVLTLKKGTYTYVCDPHASSMKGSFKVS